MFKKVDSKMNLPKMEEEILGFWEREKIFEKSVAKEAPKGGFVFYEGPPTANGRPGLHHVLARSFKDIIPRYKTMKGYRVRRKAGWDTHGLPVELQVEKVFGLRSKQDIENIVPGDSRASVIEFNKKCKESVWEYRDLWEKLTQRMGYWVDMEHPYVTYENSYIESVWWQLAQIAKLKNAKDESFLYKGHKVVPYCYRCGTALSSHEVAQGYKEVIDNSVYVKFRAMPGQKIGNFTTDENTYFLAWTTTPWTLPGNAALAVNPNFKYFSGKVKKLDGNIEGIQVGDTLVFCLESIGNFFKKRFEKNSGRLRFGDNSIEVPMFVMDGKDGDILATLEGEGWITFDKDNYEVFLGEKMLGWRYEQLFDTVGEDVGKSYWVVAGDFVTTDSGTGIVHIAPAFGEDDANVAMENDIPILLAVEEDGMLKKGFNLPGEGIPVKKLNDKNRYAVDDLIIGNLKERNLLFAEEPYKHEYPFCWRCDTPLIYYAKPSWFIRMSELREDLVKNNEAINWVPEHIKEGRFGEWLRGVKDWAISRERYWGTPLPIWICEKPSCKYDPKVIESVTELERLSGKALDDLHKPYIDDVEFPCECGSTMRRTPEVLDVWFDSGAMPLAQFGYPASVSPEEKQLIEGGTSFPADYICEAIDQTRGWFYTLHAVANLLAKAGVVKEGRAYKNVICLGHILDAKGKKMSKSKGNIVDSFEMFDRYGADALRWLLFSINQPGLPKRFDEKGMRDVQNRVFRMLWNSYLFFVTYANVDGWEPSKEQRTGSQNILDRWMLSELQMLIRDTNSSLEQYDVYGATQKIEKFIDHLSNWYIRRSRKRFWKSEDDADKDDAYHTLHEVLLTLSRLMAPFTPFIAEEMYRNLTEKESVHLEDFPVADEGLLDENLLVRMDMIRDIINDALKERSIARVKVRQPLHFLEILYKDGEHPLRNLEKEFLDILKEEVNVKEVRLEQSSLQSLNDPLLRGWMLSLDTEITPELRLEGEAREIIRAIQEGRKKAGFNVEDRIVLGYSGKETAFAFSGDMSQSVPNLKETIEKEVLATEVKNEALPDAEYSEEVNIEGEKFTFWLRRV